MTTDDLPAFRTDFKPQKAGQRPGVGGRRFGPRSSTRDPETKLGVRLRDERMNRGMTQNQMAELLDTQANRVTAWESGRHIPTLAALQRYATAFGMTVADLLKGVM
jgi:DNA-binding XRE family transcriptional regulator